MVTVAVSFIFSTRLILGQRCYVIMPRAREVLLADLVLSHSFNKKHMSKCESFKLETSIKGLVRTHISVSLQ